MRYLALLVDEELAPAPRDDVRRVRGRMVELTLETAECVNRVGVGAVHIDLREHGELGVVASGKGFDISLSTGLLVPELVARECKDLESSLAILIVELHHLPIVLVCQASLRDHVDNQDTLFAFENLTEAFDVLSIDVSGTDVMQAARIINESFCASLLNCGNH